MNTQKRIINFEILRTISMLFIVIWHCFIHGINFSNYPFTTSNVVDSFNFLVSIILLAISSIAVNCFILISGYFMINRYQINYKRFEKVWLHAFFYTLIIVLFICIKNQSWIDLKLIYHVIRSGTGYWFVDKYLGLLLIAPFISMFINTIKKVKYQALLIVLLFVNISLFNPIYISTFMGEVNGGYSLQWFIFLFLCGGYLKKYSLLANTKINAYLYIILIILLFCEIAIKFYFFHRKSMYSINYNGLTFFISIAFFAIIRNHTFKSIAWKPFIYVAPYTFGVYLLHDSDLVRDYVWKTLFNANQYIHTWGFIPICIFYSVTIFFSGIFIDYIRKILVRAINGEKLLQQFNSYIQDSLYRCPYIGEYVKNLKKS